MKTIITIITILLFACNVSTAQVLDTFICGNTFLDLRDGKTYKTVLIGGIQCWMAENLNFGVYVSLATGQGAAGIQKYCYNDSVLNCNTYGGLYEWTEMMNGATACNGLDSSHPACTTPAQGICPNGWHVPSHYEWTFLERHVGSDPEAFTYDTVPDGFHVYIGIDEGSNLKDTGTAHWNYHANTGGTNSSGFTALGGGTSYFTSGNSGPKSFANIHEFGDWWTSTEGNSPISAWNHHLDYAYANVFRFYHNKPHGFSVRCVKDSLYITDIKENTNENHLKVSPNPSSNHITIKALQDLA